MPLGRDALPAIAVPAIGKAAHARARGQRSAAVRDSDLFSPFWKSRDPSDVCYGVPIRGDRHYRVRAVEEKVKRQWLGMPRLPKPAPIRDADLIPLAQSASHGLTGWRTNWRSGSTRRNLTSHSRAIALTIDRAEVMPIM